MNVLVADDDRIAATVLSQTLRQWEFEVTTVAAMRSSSATSTFITSS